METIKSVRGGLFNTGPWGDKVVTVAGEARVVLSGGCFQNRLLSARVTELLYEVDGQLVTSSAALSAGRLDRVRVFVKRLDDGYF